MFVRKFIKHLHFLNLNSFFFQNGIEMTIVKEDFSDVFEEENVISQV